MTVFMLYTSLYHFRLFFKYLELDDDDDDDCDKKSNRKDKDDCRRKKRHSMIVKIVILVVALTVVGIVVGWYVVYKGGCLVNTLHINSTSKLLIRFLMS